MAVEGAALILATHPADGLPQLASGRAARAWAGRRGGEAEPDVVPCPVAAHESIPMVSACKRVSALYILLAD
jgi:hypothetical protein